MRLHFDKFMENKLDSQARSKILKLLRNGEFPQALELSDVLCSVYSNFKNQELKALCLFSCGKKKEALELMYSLIESYPKKSSLWNTLGLMHGDSGSSLARGCFSRAFSLSKKPSYLSNLAIEIKKADVSDAVSMMGEWSEKFCGDYLYCFNYGAVLHESGDYRSAKDWYLKSISLRKNFPTSHFNLSYCHFSLGEYESGWKEYEWRWKQFPSYAWKKSRFSKKKLWDGSDLTGKTILLYGEQGAGDVIQFSRYVRKLKGNVILEVPSELHRLFAGLGVKLIEGCGGEKFDFHYPLVSLGGHFPVSGEKYLEWDCGKWGVYKDKPRVGVCWGGNPAHQNDRWRSCPLKMFNFGDKVHLFSLQKDVRTRLYGKEAVDLTDGFDGSLIDLGPKLGDYGNLASAVQNMDLVVTVDTSLAHLCGALGKKCLMVLPKNHDWRWWVPGWYDSVEIFKQEVLGEWGDVFAKVSERLSSLLVVDL